MQSLPMPIGYVSKRDNNLGAHVPRDGEFALHADCEEFDSLCLHQIIGVLNESPC
ncbi:hypothetical protein PSPHG_CDS_0196 [Pseudomonas phage Psxphi15]